MLGVFIGGFFGLCVGYAIGVLLTMWASRAAEVERALESARRPVAKRGES